MHYTVLVILPKDHDHLNTLEDVVGQLLERFKDEEWDWWQIGGRWTGSISSKPYDPRTDARNLEQCQFCENGVTTSAIAEQFPAYQEHIGQTCPQCNGTGERVKWPTQWAPYLGDVEHVELIPDGFKPYAVCDGTNWWGSERYLPPDPNHPIGRFEKVELPDWRSTFAGRLAVVVDCHN